MCYCVPMELWWGCLWTPGSFLCQSPPHLSLFLLSMPPKSHSPLSIPAAEMEKDKREIPESWWCPGMSAGIEGTALGHLECCLVKISNIMSSSLNALNNQGTLVYHHPSELSDPASWAPLDHACLFICSIILKYLPPILSSISLTVRQDNKHSWYHHSSTILYKKDW